MAVRAFRLHRSCRDLCRSPRSSVRGRENLGGMYSYPPVCPSLSCVQKMSRHGYARNSAEHAAVLPRDRGGLTGEFFLPAACLVLVVVLRSFDGLLFSFDWNDGQRTGVLLTCMIFLGKCLGGFAADGGTIWASVCSLGAAAVLLAFSGFPAAGLSGVLFFNMTMPVTLYELYRRLPGNSGAAFGLLTFALYLGFLPVYTGMTEGMRHPLYYSVFALISLFLLAMLSEKAGKEDSGLKEEEEGWL